MYEQSVCKNVGAKQTETEAIVESRVEEIIAIAELKYALPLR